MYDNNLSYNDLMYIRDLDSCLFRELCRRFLWYYCMATEPDFYNSEHMYLKTICDRLQAFIETNDNKYFVLSIPPQHGKSRTIKKLEEWLLGNDIKKRFFSISYSEEYATDSSKNLLTAIRAEQEDDKIAFCDIFPGICVKRGEGAVNRWALEGGYNTWLSASTSSGVTGRSANIVVVDDIVKDYKTAVNKKELEKIWTWFANTLFSRRGDNNQKYIIVMTRWSKNDLAGKILKRFKNVDNLVMKAYDEETDTMLCDAILNKESYEEICKTSSEDLIMANYNQQPIDLKGQLYTHFNTYKDTDKPGFRRICCVTDTADSGDDWLCSIVFGETYDKKAYIIDVLFTQEAVELTIEQQAQFLKKNRVNVSVTESNNGGKMYALAVKKRLSELKHFCTFKWFHQSSNKYARILTNSADVMRRVYFPENWETKFFEYYTSMSEYQKMDVNEHDDAADATTMILELIDGRLKTNN